jgi:predicted SprT family Zn-dependent metalloprotease
MAKMRKLRYNYPMIEKLPSIQLTANLLWGNYRKVFPKIGDCPIVTLNNRFSSTAGVCIVEKRNVQLASKYLVNNFALMMVDTLPHELAHQIDVDLNGLPKNNRWHGPTWKQIVVELKIQTSTLHRMTL